MKTSQAIGALPLSFHPAKDRVALFAGVLLILFLAAPSLMYPFGRDQAIFACVADRWLRGGLPYRASFDLKPPGIYALYALAELVFGRSMMAIRLLDLLAVFITCGGLWAIGKRFGSNLAAGASAILFAVAYLLDNNYWDTAQAESFAAPVTVWLVWTLWQLREGMQQEMPAKGMWYLSGLAGLLLSCLLLLKTPLVLLALLLPFLFWPVFPKKGDWKVSGAVLAFLGMFLLPIFITLLTFGLPLIRELLATQQGYAAHQMNGLLQRLLPACSAYLSAHRFTGALGGMALAAFLWPVRPLRFERGLVGLWLGLALAIVLAQGRLYSYHFLILLPPLALLAGCGLDSILMKVRGWSFPTKLALVTTSLIILSLFAIAEDSYSFCLAYKRVTGTISADNYWRSFTGVYSYCFLDQVEAADYVRSHTLPTDTILVYAFEPAIYFLSERDWPTRHLSNAPIIGEVTIPLAMRRGWHQELLTDCARRPPHLLLLMAGPWPLPLGARKLFAQCEYTLAARRGPFLIYQYEKRQTPLKSAQRKQSLFDRGLCCRQAFYTKPWSGYTQGSRHDQSTLPKRGS